MECSSDLILVLLRSKAHEVISCHLEAEPRASHGRSDLEQVWADTLVQTTNAFLRGDHADGVEDALVLVAHAGHCVDLEAAAEDVATIWCQLSADLVGRNSIGKLTVGMCRFGPRRRRWRQHLAFQRLKGLSHPLV
jgi:hypothetical protein